MAAEATNQESQEGEAQVKEGQQAAQSEFEQILSRSAELPDEVKEKVEETKGKCGQSWQHLPKKTQDRLAGALEQFAQTVVGNKDIVSENALETLDAAISMLDRKLTEQLNQIMHHEKFRKLEGTWRGLSFMLNYPGAQHEELKVRVLNVSKEEAGKSLRKYGGARFEQSPLYQKIYRDEYNTPGAAPYGCLIGDYQFDHSPQDVEMLENVARLARHAHCPFISGTSPNLMGMQSWSQLPDVPDLKKRMSGPDYIDWEAFRESDDARYVALTMPPFLSRLPYSANTQPVEEFAFEEEAHGNDLSTYVWSNAAYGLGTCVARAFSQYGWCAKIRGKESFGGKPGGGVLQGLPVHRYETDDGQVDITCPSQVSIDEAREKELSDLGLMSLLHWKGKNEAAFVGAQTIKKPAKFTDPEDQRREELGCRLPYIFSTCRFAHFLKRMVYDKIGTHMERSDVEKWLNNWIMDYVINDDNAGDEMKARYPLRAAQVVVKETDNPGAYEAEFYLRPHYQLEDLKASMTLVGELPKSE